MAWSWVQSPTGVTATAATSVSATFTNNVAAGNVIIVAVAQSAGTGGTSTVTDGSSNSWTKITSVGLNGSTANGELSLWSRVVPAGDVGTKPTLTATFGSANRDGGILIAEVSGILATVDGTAGTKTGSGGTSTGSATYTSTALNEFLVCIFGDDGNSVTWTDPSGYQGATTGPGSAGSATGVNTSAVDDIEIAYKNSTNGSETGSYALSPNTPDNWAIITVAFQLTAAGGPQARQSRLRMFRQRLLPSPPPTAAAGIPGTTQPQPTFPLPRRIPARAVWRGRTGTVGIRGTVQPQPTFPLPRRRLSRGLWGGLAGTTGIRGTVQPRPTVTQPRRNPYARAVWHGGTGAIAPSGIVQPRPTVPTPRRTPARAFIQFTPVTTTNQVPPAVPSGTVQPQPTTTPPRLHPSRAFVRFTPVTTINAGIPGQTQPWPTIRIPRRRPGRAVIEFTPVTTTNQVVAGISGTVQPRATLTWPRRKPVRAYTAVTYHPVRTVNAPPAAFVPALSPTGAGGSIEGELWRMARDGDWPRRPPGFGPVGEVPSSSAPREQASGRGWVGKKVRRFFWPREED